MSTLEMPTMTLDALKALTRGRDVNIAYKTRATWHTDKAGTTVTIRHHGNAIASISQNDLLVTGAGWNSVTTANRLRKILADNTVGANVFIKNGQMYIETRDGKRYLSDRLAHFSRDESGHWGEMYIV